MNLELNKFKYLFFILFAVFLCSCETSINSREDLLVWMADKKNDLTKEQQSNGFTLVVKYLPPEYLALNELNEVSGKGEEKKLYKTYLKDFSLSRNFLMTIEHKNDKIDITNYNVASLDEYKRRIDLLNFNIKEYIYLKSDDGIKHFPVIANMENTYEIANRKSISLVFIDSEQSIMNSKTLDLIFEDEFFDTGISHFKFKKEDMDNIPEITFIN